MPENLVVRARLADVDGVSLGTLANPIVVSVGGSGAGAVDQGAAGTAAAAWWVRPTADGATVSLPLPAGAATAAAQATGNASLSSIDGKLSSQATAAKQPALGVAGTASADVLTVQGRAGMVALLVDGSGATQPVSGTVTVTAATLPLPSGASTAAKQPALGTAGTASADVITVQGVASMTALKTDGSAVTQPVSAAALPLPSGAATSAKQPALGTAGTAAADVLSVQGVASMTPLVVQGCAASGAAVSGNPVLVAVKTGANAATLTTGQATMANSVPVALASDQGALTTQPATATWTLAAVAASATSVTIAAANASRKGLTVFNNSTGILYLRKGGGAADATTGNFVGIVPQGYWEMPAPLSTAAVTGIWSIASGSANVDEAA